MESAIAVNQKIYHVAGPCRNYGDIALVKTMRRLLELELSNREYPNPPYLEWITVDCKQDQKFSTQLVNEISQRNAAFRQASVIVGGGGMMMKGDNKNTASGWQFDISRRDLISMKAPLISYAIGHNEFPGEVFSKLTKDNLRAFFRKCSWGCRGVRDLGSYKFVMDNNIYEGTDPIKVLPDPAMFGLPFEYSAPLPDDRFIIGVNVAGDRLEMRGITNLVEYYCQVLDPIMDFVKDNFPSGMVVEIPHVAAYDVHPEITAFLKARYGEDNYANTAELFPDMYPESSAYLAQFFHIYSQLDMLVGMRGHSNIIAFGQNVPFVGLGHHNKIEYFCKEVGAPFCKSPEALKLVLEKELSRYDSTKARFKLQKDKFEHILDKFNAHVMDTILGTVG